MKKRAIIYTDNLEKVEVLAGFLSKEGWEIISAGSTADFIKSHNIKVTVDNSLTSNGKADGGFMKILNMILVSGQSPEETGQKDSSGEIKLVCVNIEPAFYKLHDFLAIESSENCIDLRHISLIRSSAKNYKNVLVLTDPADYNEAIIQLRNDSIKIDFRLYLAGKALNLSAAYDAAAADSIMFQGGEMEYPNYYLIPYKKFHELRHGMNGHQTACLYNICDNVGMLGGTKKIQGREISYSIIRNSYTAWREVSLFLQVIKNPFTVDSADCEGNVFTTQFTPAAGSVFTVGIKNTNPIGAALGSNVAESFKKTFSCASRSFSGAVLGCSAVIDEAAAREMVCADMRAVIAPDFTREARQIFSEQKELSLINSSKLTVSAHEFISLDGGIIVQQSDTDLFKKWHVVTHARPTQPQIDAMAFGMMIALTAKSYAAVIVRGASAVGISTGQIEPGKAVLYALGDMQECMQRGIDAGSQDTEILVSDSVLPFDDEMKKISDFGIKAIIQTGGSPSDKDFIDYCNSKGIAMIFTGINHLSY